ncbi:1915_t:CDS:2 [Entrophospora sp. SA101]|nr:1915_t:CDS:2 [Entrophospora sp. SA101]CAJ0845156.1 20166_t:CDS:2 [Entrophospora sp. SA101]
MNLIIPPIFQPLIQTVVALLAYVLIVFPLNIAFFILDVGKYLINLLDNKSRQEIPIPKVVLITGASTGIGAAFAVEYAAPGVTLGLLGRNEVRLNEVAEHCKEKGANCVLLKVDISNIEKLTKILENFDDSHPIELLISNAAQFGATRDNFDTVSWEDGWKRMIDVNYTGNVATIMTVYKRMKGRRFGQIAVTSAIACFFNSPSFCYYNATKSALTTFSQDLRYIASFDNVKVSVIIPGTIDTNMLRSANLPFNKFYGPGDSNDLAKIVRNQLNSDTFCIGWPFHQYLIFWAISTFPVRTKLTFCWIYGKLIQKVTGCPVAL